jgi:hypothetical protein
MPSFHPAAGRRWAQGQRRKHAHPNRGKIDRGVPYVLCSGQAFTASGQPPTKPIKACSIPIAAA